MLVETLSVAPVAALIADPLGLGAVIAAAALLITTIVLLVAWLRARGRARREVFDRTAAERQRLELERALAEQTGRLRIIRELHEVAVPAVSDIISQADGARYAATGDPTAAARAAAAIADAARTTLGDLRRVMGIVREGEARGPGGARPTSPDALFAVMRDRGLEVEFEELGEPFELQQGAERVIAGILQESLENALRYGGPGTTARVAFTWAAEGLHLKVDDDGIRATARRAGLDPNDASPVGYTIDDDLKALTDEPRGRGIAEMRSRAELYGGILTAATVPGVGFSLSAVFPALRFHNGVHGVKLERG